MARPMRGRGRALIDPRRVELMNAGGIASRRGALIKVGGHLVPRCECCLDCGIPCALDKFDALACGPCTPRNLLVGVGGVEVCDCEYVSDPPTDPRFGAWAGVIGDVNGSLCASNDGGEPFFSPSPCVYMAVLGATCRFFLDKLEPFECDTAPDGISAYSILIIEMMAGTPPRLRGRIRTGGGVGPLPAESEIFWGESDFLGWQAVHVIDNVFEDCGITDQEQPPFFIEGAWVLGKHGQMVIRPCCFV